MPRNNLECHPPSSLCDFRGIVLGKKTHIFTSNSHFLIFSKKGISRGARKQNAVTPEPLSRAQMWQPQSLRTRSEGGRRRVQEGEARGLPCSMRLALPEVDRGHRVQIPPPHTNWVQDFCLPCTKQEAEGYPAARLPGDQTGQTDRRAACGRLGPVLQLPSPYDVCSSNPLSCPASHTARRSRSGASKEAAGGPPTLGPSLSERECLATARLWHKPEADASTSRNPKTTNNGNDLLCHQEDGKKPIGQCFQNIFFRKTL